MPARIKKRDGTTAKFDQRKIEEAIYKATKAIGEPDRGLARTAAMEVTHLTDQRIKGTPTVEQVQDIVEEVLVKARHYELAKAYILYRKQHEHLRQAGMMFSETEQVVDDYLKQKDWRVKENANLTYSFAGLLLYISERVVAEYALDRVYPKEVSAAHKNGDFHIHNLSFGITGYCAGWNLQQLLMEGFNGVPGKVASEPAKHLDTALMQMVNFLGTLQNEWAGAMAFNSVDTYLAPFVANDKLTYKKVKQDMQKFVFNLNTSSRWGGQTLFTNLTWDWNAPKDLAKQGAFVGGKRVKDTYADFQDEMDMLNKAFIEVLTEGDMNKRPFTFPIPTYNIDKDFDWDSENAELLFDMTAKYGLPYFSNFVNSNMKPSDIRSMCCHLRLDMRQLRKNVRGGLFGSSDSTGSVGVVTMNMPRLGHVAKGDADFFEKLGELMDLAKESLEIKRKTVSKNMNNGLLPYSKRYLGTLDNHFSTIGLVGMNEACLNLLGEDISTRSGRKLAEKTLRFMLQQLKEFQNDTGHLYNLEATPAEGCSYRLARIDKEKHPRIKQGSARVPRYTNSTQLPVDATADVFLAIEHQESLQSQYTGGTVFHAFFGERMSNGEACKAFVKKVMYNSKLPYLTATPTYSICPDHGYLSGEHATCPKCKKACEVYSRVVGYFRPVSQWNEGKQEEFRQRKEYKQVM
ncbi:MAG: ribonucleoside triphosphate reductase [Candidatus Diapherotrites archaeon]|nr:ribonucleoside triphosphate reductase [Candidatus Diapherotrites archaeon]